MKAFETKIIIHAPAEAVWALLTDAPNWTAWNPTVDRIEGTIAPGQKVTVHAKISPGRAFPVTVSEFVPNEKMVWSSSMPLGLFKGARTYTLTPLSDSEGILYTMREEFTGPLAPMITRSIPDLQPAFEEFAQALKARAEISQV
jgi:hypothetical protein